MPRPQLTCDDIAPQTRGWDGRVDTNFSKVEQHVNLTPFALCLLHRSTPTGASQPIASFPAVDYNQCYAHLVDPATQATNGNLIFSNGTNWIYQRSNAVVS